MSVAETIQRKLESALAPCYLTVKDESHLHAGHASAPEGGQSHFRIKAVSEKFKGLPQVARHRLVNEALRDELTGPVHALTMQTLTPEEAESRQARGEF